MVFLALGSAFGLIAMGDMSDNMLAWNHIVAAALSIPLLLWIGFSGTILRRGFGAFKWFSWFAILQVIGLGSSFMGHEHMPGPLRDSAATISALLLTMCAIELFDRGCAILFWRLVLLCSLPNSLLLVPAVVVGDLPGLAVWYGNRYAGLARNPNQTALFAIVAIIGSMVLLRQRIPKWQRLGITAACISSFGVGIATGSSAFRLAVGTLLIGSLIFNAFAPSGRFRQLRPMLAALLVIIISILPVLVHLKSIMRGADRGGEIIRDSSQEEYRLLLWREAIRLIGEYPAFGRGGGAVGGTFDITLSYEGMEAHNTFLDLTISMGICGLVLYLFLLARIARRLWRQQQISALTGLAFLLAMSTFHNLVRQPFFWITIGYFYWLSGRGAQQVSANPTQAKDRLAFKKPGPDGNRTAEGVV